MGSSASVDLGAEAQSNNNINSISFKKLPEAIEEAVYVSEKFPLIIDTAGQAGRFLKYQMGSYFDADDNDLSIDTLNRALVGAIQYGRTLTLKVNSLENIGLATRIFQPSYFPQEILNRSEFFTDNVWKSVFKVSSGDPDPNEINISPDFIFIICTCTEFIPPDISNLMQIIMIDNNTKNSESSSNGNRNEDPMEQIAELYGASEIVRNSIPLVEAAFDGDLNELKNWIDKGYHIESVDGRKHTALSEASSQGHLNIVSYLLQLGADPNALNDTGRSPLWRAVFNSHIEVTKLLLSAGGDPDGRDVISMESAYDVAQSDEMRELLVSTYYIII